MWLLAVVVVVLVVGGVVGIPGFGGSNSQSIEPHGGSLNVTEFTVLNSSCGDSYSGIGVMRANVVEDHRTNYSIIGTIPVQRSNVSAGSSDVITLADSYVINVTSSALYAEQNSGSCEARYRMNYSVPYGGDDSYTLTTLHNGEFIAQQNNVQFENGSLTSSSYDFGVSTFYNMSA